MIIEFIGVPCSGKTTTVKKLKEKLISMKYIVFDREHLRYLLSKLTKLERYFIYINLLLNKSFIAIQFNNFTQFNISLKFRYELIKWTFQDYALFKIINSIYYDFIILDESISQRFISSIVYDNYLTASLNYDDVSNFIDLSIYLDEKIDVVEKRLVERAPILRFRNLNMTQIMNNTILYKDKIYKLLNQRKKKYMIHKNSIKLNTLLDEIIELKS